MMGQSPREIRVFVSSTFRDMEDERNHLITHVFPGIRKMCLERDVTFSEIDLRWGVTEQESRNGRTIELCLQEIERCRDLGIPPFFIGLLGERYGWVPVETELTRYWLERGETKYGDDIRNALTRQISVTELEMRFGFMDAQSMSESRARVYLRDPELTARMARSSSDGEDQFYDRSGAKRLDSLKSEIRNTCALGIDGYTSVLELGDAVKRYLHAEIAALFPLADVPDAAARMRRAHVSYAVSRLRAYVPQKSLERELVRLLCADGANLPFCVIAPAGMGKSSLMARMENLLSENGSTVFSHFVGIDGARGVGDWLTRIVDTFGKLDPRQDDPRRVTPLETRAESALESRARDSGSLVVLLTDALNQFDDPPSAVNALARFAEIEGVVVLATTTPDVAVKGWRTLSLPILTKTQRQTLVSDYLSPFGKRLSSTLSKRLAGATQSESPLFLKLALEQLRQHATHSQLNEALTSVISATDAGDLFLTTLSSLDRNFRSAAVKRPASQVAQLIALSRDGLSHSDLASLTTHLAGRVRTRLPDHLLVPLLNQLDPYCLFQDGRYLLMHESLRMAAGSSALSKRKSRRIILSFFNGKDAYSVAERLFQARNIYDRDEIVKALSDSRRLAAVFRQFPNELRSAIQFLKSGDAATYTRHLKVLALSWQEAFFQRMNLPKDFDHIGIWLHDEGYEDVGRAWQVGLVDHLRRRAPNSLRLANASFDLGNIDRTLGRRGYLRYYEESYWLARSLGRSAKQLTEFFGDTLLSEYRHLELHSRATPILLDVSSSLKVAKPYQPAKAFEAMVALGENYEERGLGKKAYAVLLGALEVLHRSKIERDETFASALRILARRLPEAALAMRELRNSMFVEADRIELAARRHWLAPRLASASSPLGRMLSGMMSSSGENSPSPLDLGAVLAALRTSRRSRTRKSIGERS